MSKHAAYGALRLTRILLFRSAAETFRHRTLGVVLTGMGSDGKQGAAWIKSQGGMVFTEAEDSCIIYGMPARS